jgi:hypothetical protein
VSEIPKYIKSKNSEIQESAKELEKKPNDKEMIPIDNLYDLIKNNEDIFTDLLYDIIDMHYNDISKYIQNNHLDKDKLLASINFVTEQYEINNNPKIGLQQHKYLFELSKLNLVNVLMSSFEIIVNTDIEEHVDVLYSNLAVVIYSVSNYLAQSDECIKIPEIKTVYSSHNDGKNEVSSIVTLKEFGSSVHLNILLLLSKNPYTQELYEELSKVQEAELYEGGLKIFLKDINPNYIDNLIGEKKIMFEIGRALGKNVFGEEFVNIINFNDLTSDYSYHDIAISFLKIIKEFQKQKWVKDTINKEQSKIQELEIPVIDKTKAYKEFNKKKSNRFRELAALWDLKINPWKNLNLRQEVDVNESVEIKTVEETIPYDIIVERKKLVQKLDGYINGTGSLENSTREYLKSIDEKMSSPQYSRHQILF